MALGVLLTEREELVNESVQILRVDGTVPEGEFAPFVPIERSNAPLLHVVV